jgi:small G protein signaling modulator 3
VSRTSHSLVGSLIASAPNDENRSALFDDNVYGTQELPGNLHHASLQHIHTLLERHGAVNLVRQLAKDLAQRDAHMTVLRRKSEERERILRKMLRARDVSTIEIESQLRTLERVNGRSDAPSPSRSASIRNTDSEAIEGTLPESAMESRLALALHDEQIADIVCDDSSLLGLDISKPPSLPEQGREDDAVKSNSGKFWKSYIWAGQRNANLHTQKGNRKATQLLSSEARSSQSNLISPVNRPSPTTQAKGPKSGSGMSSVRRLQSEENNSSASSSRRSSTSISSWALKLVAGGAQASRSAENQTVNQGAPGTGKADASRSRRSSSGSAKAQVTIRATNHITAKALAIKSAGESVSTKSAIDTDNLRAVNANATSTSPLAATHQGLDNIGPVEMDTILPEASRPPTLTQHHNHMSNSQEFLTDRFGFIYDQRRRRRQYTAESTTREQTDLREDIDEAKNLFSGDGLHGEPNPQDQNDNVVRPNSAHSSMDENNPRHQPPKRWYDYLKIATTPTELLSHTPSAAYHETLEPNDSKDEKPSGAQLRLEKRGSILALRTNPLPSPTRVVSGNAEFSSPSSTTGNSTGKAKQSSKPQDPVKALLEQLTEVHDNLQKERTVKWNDFLRKVRAERTRRGEATSAMEGKAQYHPPEASLVDGEVIGVTSLRGTIGRAKWKEFRVLVLGGIPVAYRAKIWAECSGAASLRIPGYYDDLISSDDDDPAVVTQIQMDITRTLTDNIFFRKGPGVHKLKEVLLAYSKRNTEVGYCQGMNLIAACLLLIMPTAEDAFWVLASMIENILPENYYDHFLLTSRADQVVLRQYVAEVLPKLSRHLDDLSIELEALSFQWFLSVFTDCLSAEALFRVWDVVLCMHDGATFLFQVALALLKLNEPALLECDSPAAVYHYINHQMTNHAISIDGLVQASEALRKVVRRRDVEARRAVAVDRERTLIKEREQLRRQRSQKAKTEELGNEGNNHSVKDTSGVSVDGLTKDNDSAVNVKQMQLSRHASSSHNAAEDETGTSSALESLTPLPIDEEVLWRG